MPGMATSEKVVSLPIRGSHWIGLNGTSRRPVGEPLHVGVALASPCSARITMASLERGTSTVATVTTLPCLRRLRLPLVGGVGPLRLSGNWPASRPKLDLLLDQLADPRLVADLERSGELLDDDGHLICSYVWGATPPAPKAVAGMRVSPSCATSSDSMAVLLWFEFQAGPVYFAGRARETYQISAACPLASRWVMVIARRAPKLPCRTERNHVQGIGHQRHAALERDVAEIDVRGELVRVVVEASLFVVVDLDRSHSPDRSPPGTPPPSR